VLSYSAKKLKLEELNLQTTTVLPWKKQREELLLTGVLCSSSGCCIILLFIGIISSYSCSSWPFTLLWFL